MRCVWKKPGTIDMYKIWQKLPHRILLLGWVRPSPFWAYPWPTFLISAHRLFSDQARRGLIRTGMEADSEPPPHLPGEPGPARETENPPHAAPTPLSGSSPDSRLCTTVHSHCHLEMEDGRHREYGRGSSR